MALVWIIVKLLFFNFGIDKEYFTITVMLNLLCLIIAIFASLHFSYDQNSAAKGIGFLSQFKSAARSGAIYTVLIYVFMLVYYSGLDTKYTEDELRARIEQIESMTDEQWEAYKEKDGIKAQDYSKYDAIAEKKEEAAAVLSPFAAATLTLMALIISTMFFALIGTIFYRKVLVRFR